MLLRRSLATSLCGYCGRLLGAGDAYARVDTFDPLEDGIGSSSGGGGSGRQSSSRDLELRRFERMAGVNTTLGGSSPNGGSSSGAGASSSGGSRSSGGSSIFASNGGKGLKSDVFSPGGTAALSSSPAVKVVGMSLNAAVPTRPKPGKIEGKITASVPVRGGRGDEDEDDFGSAPTGSTIRKVGGAGAGLKHLAKKANID